MSEWIKCTLADIADVIMGQSPKSEYYNNEGNGMPFLQGNRTFGRIYPTFDTYTTMPTKVAKAGDVIMSVRAPVGDLNITPIDMCLGRGVCSLRIKNGNQRFLFYLMKYTIPSLIRKESGTVFGSVNRNDINNLEITIPTDLEDQNRIVALLDEIDSKIENNNAINDNLEQQAIAIFNNLFCSDNLTNSEFGNIPNWFDVTKVGEIPMTVTDYVANGSFASLKENVTLYQEPNYAYFIRNTDLKSGSFGVYVDEHSYKFLSKSTLFGGEIIISNVGDVGSVFLCPDLNAPMTLGNNIIMLRPNNKNLTYYLYIWFKYSFGQALIQGIKGGSAQPKFNKTDFKNLSIAIPSTDILNHFNETVSPFFELINKNNEEIKQLALLRDTLLPKLMSGELDVSNIDI